MQKRILIHTLFYKNYNYGGMLQAYALYHKLQAKGYDCEELNYSQLVDNRIKKLFHRGFRIIEILKDPLFFKESKQKSIYQTKLRNKYILDTGDPIKKVFEEFMEKEFNYTEVYTPDTISRLKAYDYYIAGGDRVWNPEWTDINFFFGNIKKGKKIGYSCSAGKSNFTKTDKKKIFKYARLMDTISVREKNFSDILYEGNIENQIIADPVFLLRKEEWSDFANDRYELPEKYIFAYLLGDDNECRRIIKNFAKKSNMKIVSIPHVFRFFIKSDEYFADIKIRDAGPREFISLIKNANFIITDSFHGSAFSLIFEKQFLNFYRFKSNDKRSLNARLKNVVEEYELEHRLININDLELIDINNLQQINYEKCRCITQLKRKTALEFLNNTLD